MVKPKRVGHLVINVKDVDTSVKFYRDVLGFELALERPGFGTFLTCGKIHHDLALFQAKPDAAPVTPGGLGLNHMADRDLDRAVGMGADRVEIGILVEAVRR